MPLQLISKKDRDRLNRFPEFTTTDELNTYYQLSDEDKREVFKQREAHSQLGYALQLGTLRHLGFIPSDVLEPASELLHFLADQLNVAASSFQGYRRRSTQSNHFQDILRYTGFRRASPLDTLALVNWLSERALEHDKPLLLFELACDYLRKQKIVRLGITLLEQYISEARSKAHTLTFEKLRPVLTPPVQAFLEKILELREDKRNTYLSWLQQTPTDSSPTQIREAAQKIFFLKDAGVMNWDVTAVNPNRFKWLAKLGARISKQNLLNSIAERRDSVLVAFLHQSLYSYIDDGINMFDQRLWTLYTQAKNKYEVDRHKAQSAINENLNILQRMGEVLLDESLEEDQVRQTIFEQVERQKLQNHLQQNKALLRPPNDAYVDYFFQQYQAVRNVAKPLLATLTFEPWGDDQGLMEALGFVKEIHDGKRKRIPRSASTGFVPQDWLSYLWQDDGEINRFYYELAAVWVLREKLRSGDVYVNHSRRYAPLESYLIPKEIWSAQRQVVHELTGAPLTARSRLEKQKAELTKLCETVEAALTDETSSLTVRQNQLSYKHDDAEILPLRLQHLKNTLHASLHQVDITEVMLEVDKETNFSEAFEHLSQSKRPSPDVLLHLYACVLAQGCNLGFSYMSHSTGLDYHALRDCNSWFMTQNNLDRAMTLLVNKHHDLPFCSRWGGGMLSSSDGQRFPMSKKGKTLLARHNPRYFGLHKGVTFYTWTSDQFSQYGSKAIPTTVRDATYVLDAILDNESELPILEHTTDTSGYTELIFAVFDLLGLKFIPRIRDLKEQTLYRTRELDLTLYPTLAPCLTAVIQEDIAEQYWDEMLRFVGSLKLGYVTASLIIQKLQAYPRKHQLTRALQAYGRLPKTLHILRWYTQSTLRQRAGLQLNKGEAIHDLRSHIAFANQGKIRTKTTEQLDHQVGCLNLLSNIVIYWNTLKLEQCVNQLKAQGYPIVEEDLKHIWPTRYQNINVYGTYSFDRDGIMELQKQRGLT
ncbi:MAG: Tn3 family transposase [Trueperaceae bacterium]